MDKISIQDQFNTIINKYLDIEEITWGDERLNYLVRYRGNLRMVSVDAYDNVTNDLSELGVIPLFRIEKEMHTIVLTKEPPTPPQTNPRTNLILFILTLFSVFIAGAAYSYSGIFTDLSLDYYIDLIRNIDEGFAFGFSIMAILLAHESAHYFAGRYHGANVTLPYFIPFPISSFGTLGAFISLRSVPKNKRALLDIGLAGPVAGFIVSIPILLIGLSLSTVEQFPLFIEEGMALSLEGNSIFYLFSKYLVFGELLPAPDTYGDTSVFIHWVEYFFTGLPTPLGGKDVILHPMAWAGWAGLLVTALNLVPAGQLDGGHILYSLFGKKIERVLPVILIAMGLMGFAWPGWWLWAGLIFLFGRSHAEPLDQITELDPKRKVFAVLGIVLFLLVFTPLPLRIIFGLYVGP